MLIRPSSTANKIVLDLSLNDENLELMNKIIITTGIYILLCIPVCFSQNPQTYFQAEIDSVNPWTNLDFYNDPNHFKFAIVTDRTGGLRPGIFAEAVHKLNLLMPEFVMSVGDFISGVTTDLDQINREWTEFDSILAPLKVPFFYLPGNHDISNDIMREYWNKKFGRAYYHFIYKNVLFVALDSNPEDAETINEDQIAYVKNSLEENPNVKWTLVFLHHPLWLYGEYAGGFTEIEKLLENRPHTVIAGHIHRYMYQVRNKTNYSTLETTGGGSQLRGPRFGEFDHVTLVTMTDEGPQLANLRLEGILPHDVTTMEDYEITRKLIQSTQLNPIVLTKPGLNFEGAKLYLSFNNPSEYPLHVYSKFFHDHTITPDSASFRFVVPPNTTREFATSITANKSVDPGMLSPLQLDWTMGYEWEDQDDLMLSGTTEIQLFPADLNLIRTPDPIFHQKLEISLNKPEKDLELRYTLDGSTPDQKSPLYQDVITITESSTLKVRGFNKMGMGSKVNEKRYEKVSEDKGLTYTYYEGSWRKLPDYTSLTPVYMGLTDGFNVRGLNSVRDHFAISFEGKIRIPKSGTYTFFTTSDDGSQLFIDGKLVVDNDGDHGPMTKSGTIQLKKGTYDFNVNYFENIGGQLLKVEWIVPGKERSELPFDILSN